MAVSFLAKFPKVNLVSIVAGVLALISMTLPWWGVERSGFGSIDSNNWNLWNTPDLGFGISPALDRILLIISLLNVFVLVLVFIAAVVSLLGSFTVHRGYLFLGLGLSITGLVAYVVGLGYELPKICQLTPNASGCSSTLIGSSGQNGVVVNWGFQSGFYLFLISAFVVTFAIFFHHSPTKQDWCSECRYKQKSRTNSGRPSKP